MAFVHPNKTAEVTHPDRAGLRGIVVGIEQHSQTLRFVVEFGTSATAPVPPTSTSSASTSGRRRELWSGRKVRKYAVRPAGVAAEEWPTPLPPGYDYDDLDAVCGLARGYAGWGAPHCALPPILSDVHSLAARTRSVVDPYFDLYRGALVAVSAAADAVGSATDGAPTPAGLGAAEWLAVLRALQQKAASSGLPEMALTFSALEEAAEAAVEPNLQALLTGTASIATLIRSPQCRQAQAYKLVAVERPRRAVRDDMYEEDVWGQETDDEDDSLAHAPPRAGAAAPGREDDEAEMDFEDAPPVEVKKRRGGWPAGKPRPKKVKLEGAWDAAAAAFPGATGDAAAFAVPAEPPTRDPEGWEIRRLSRKKAREDALSTQVRVVSCCAVLCCPLGHRRAPAPLLRLRLYCSCACTAPAPVLTALCLLRCRRRWQPSYSRTLTWTRSSGRTWRATSGSRRTPRPWRCAAGPWCAPAPAARRCVGVFCSPGCAVHARYGASHPVT